MELRQKENNSYIKIYLQKRELIQLILYERKINNTNNKEKRITNDSNDLIWYALFFLYSLKYEIYCIIMF